MTQNVCLVDIQTAEGVLGQSYGTLFSEASGPSIWLENTYYINISFYFAYARIGALVELDLGTSIQILYVGICLVDW